jgi:hypothetical protein
MPVNIWQAISGLYENNKEVYSVILLNYESYASAGDNLSCTQLHSTYT